MRPGIASFLTSAAAMSGGFGGIARGATAAGEALAKNATSTRLAIGGFSLLTIAAAAAGVAIGAVAAGRVVALADEYTTLNNKLRALSDNGDVAAGTLVALAGAADRSRAPLAGVTALYAEQAENLRALGLGERQAISLTETLARTMTISGLEVGVVGGEFKGLADKVPEVMRILQRETGKSAAELKKLGAEGRITNDTIVSALSNSASQISAKLAALPQTAGAAFAKMKETVARTFGTLATESRISETFAEIWNRIATLFAGDTFRALASGVVFAVKFIGDAFLTLGNVVAETRIVLLTFWRLISDTAAFQAAATAIGWVGSAFTTLKQNATEYVSAFAGVARGQFPGIVAAAENTVGALDAALAKTRALDAMRRSLGADDPSAGLAAAPRKVEFGPDKTSAGAADNLRKQIEAQNIQRQIVGAQLAENGALLHSLKSQLEIRQAISEAARRDQPVLAAKLEAEIRATNEAHRQLEAKGIARQVSDAQLQNEMQRAAIANDPAKQQALSLELATRQAVTAEMKMQHPELARQLTEEIRITEELQRRKASQDTLNAAGQEFAQIMADGFKNGAKEGQNFGQILGGIAAKMLEMIAQFAIIGPLVKSMGGGLGGLLGDAGISASDPVGIVGALGFANGGVFDSPVAMAGAGGFRGVMAEAGPEAIMPLRRGADGKLGIAASGGGGGSQVINIHVAGDATEETIARFRSVARAELAQAAPGIVRNSVDAVGDTYKRDARYLRR